MAKKKIGGQAAMMFEDPDELPDNEPVEPESSEPDKPDLELVPDETPAEPEPAPVDDDLPGMDEPDDPHYHATVARQEAAELKRRLAEIEERTRERPEDREAARDQQLLDARRALRQRVMAAQKSEDPTEYQAAKWELDDLEDEIRSRATERQLRHISGSGKQQPVQEQRYQQPQGGGDLQQAFIRANKVTPAELARIARDWPAFVQKNQAWGSPHINPWALMTRQLKLARTDKPATASSAPVSAAVEGGQRASGAATPGGGSNKTAFERASQAEQQKIAAAFGMTPDQYRAKLKAKKKGAK